MMIRAIVGRMVYTLSQLNNWLIKILAKCLTKILAKWEGESC